MTALCESLEHRILFALDFEIDGSVLRVFGDSNANAVDLHYIGQDQFTIIDETDPENPETIGGPYPEDRFTRVTMNLKGGNDIVQVTLLGVPLVIKTGSGDDQVSSQGEPAEVDLGKGEDIGSIRGGIVRGKSGDDFIYLHEGYGFGGTGNDVLQGNSSLATNGEPAVVFFGDSGNDHLTGGAGDDIAFGGSGDDTLYGMLGNDKLFGNGGADTLFARSPVAISNDADTLWGGAGKDTLDGGIGASSIHNGEHKNIGKLISKQEDEADELAAEV